MTRTGALKEVIRGIKRGIERLLNLLTVKYHYHCFINKPAVRIPQNVRKRLENQAKQNKVPYSNKVQIVYCPEK